ncbi:uncharacterized protein LOC100367411 [Saccoglossus kowalevskii]|uniref:Uncharacterized protein LOC100367411 n=1 Tax=Saccoglossus kowalevskii TaxID=10224 RepID=A0ABM0GN22_SACKO|nr:PREDICTED: uncharacterized protein LOC100367411 [Saccoglossus kowalevskii]
MDMTYIFSGRRQTKKPSTLRKKRDEPVPKYIDKARAIAIARQLKITRVGKVSLRINSKSSLDSELPQVPLSDTRMTTRKAILEKEKGLKTAIYTKDSAVGKCILKTNDYSERQLRRYVQCIDDDKDKTDYNMNQRKREFIAKKWHFNHEPITSVDDEITEIYQSHPGTPIFENEDEIGPVNVYKSPFNFMLPRKTASQGRRGSRLSGVFLTQTGLQSPGNKVIPNLSQSTEGRTSATGSAMVNTRENSASVFQSRPSTIGKAFGSDTEDEHEQKRVTKQVSILEVKADPLTRRKGRRCISVVGLIPKRTTTPTKGRYGTKARSITPVIKEEEPLDQVNDERFTALTGLLVPDSNHEAKLIATQYAARFAYKPKFSHRRPKDSDQINTEENSKKFDDFLNKKTLARRRKTSNKSEDC